LDISIVIPVYNALELTKRCIKSVFDHGSEHTFEIIVVDNGSAPDVEAWLQSTAGAHANFSYLRYPEPLGFAKSVNAGAAAARGDVLIILNSDTLVTPRWMDELYLALQADPSLGAITPSTNHAGEPAQMDFGTVDLPSSKALAIVARRAAGQQTAPSILYLPQRLTFFCVALRRSTWLEFDGLDEAYRVGNFEDDDLCLRLRVAGYRLGVAQHVFLYHHNNATFNANKISHGGWMTQNAATFAEHARQFSEAVDTEATRRWPRRSGDDISVVILPREGGSIERTLQSLKNQTIAFFEIILPGSSKVPTRNWTAYVTAGDILYPFHLEALHDALERNGAEAIFADGWIRGGAEALPHPDVARHIRKEPLLLSGWMHHTSLHRDLLWEECVPFHWPRLTWEMQEPPKVAADPLHASKVEASSFMDQLRNAYRRMVPLETRLAADRFARKLLRRPLPDPEQLQLQKLAVHLQSMTAEGIDAGKFAIRKTLPAVFMFNAVSWNSVVQRQHHFARGLAERGHAVFWIEPTLSPPRNWVATKPLQQVAPGVYLVRLPALARDVYTMEWNHAILEAIVDAMAASLQQTRSVYGVSDAIALVNYPRWQPLVKTLQERHGWKIAKDCLDDQRALAGLYQTVLGGYEDWLVEQADLLITSSVVLQQRLRPLPSILLHNATDYDLFSSATPAGTLQDLARPIVGFFGALADWLDMELIHAAALQFPDWTFVYIGPHTFSHSKIEVEWLRSANLPNIVVLPQMDPRELAAHLADFDVCTMPFLDIPVTRSMNPVKLYEYLSAGKPTVSRDLPEVRHLVEDGAGDLIALYSSPREFFSQLEAVLANDSPELRARRQEFAKANDWNDRVDTLSALLVDLIKE
jgi:GT2 family glycosyltransferase/glycosyltransferase involved in cell wall biosynthesis